MRIVLLLLAVAVAPAAADCPISPVSCNQHDIETPGPTYALTCEGGVALAYDIPGATIDVAAPLPVDPSARRSRVLLRDGFTIGGLPPGTPVDLHLRVRAVGDAYAAGGFGDTAGLILRAEAYPAVPGEGAVQKAWGTFAGSVAFDDSLDVVLHRTAGTAIGLEVDASLGAQYGYASAHLSFRFVDLPEGATVTSCNGYVQDRPTPALARSWGGVKAAYR